VFLGHNSGHDIDGNELPRLVYVSREKRPSFNHHEKARDVNALVSVILFPYIIILTFINIVAMDFIYEKLDVKNTN